MGSGSYIMVMFMWLGCRSFVRYSWTKWLVRYAPYNQQCWDVQGLQALWWMISMYDFLGMVYISSKKVPLEKTWAYLFLFKFFFQPLIVIYSHISSNRFLLNIVHVQYFFDNGITDDQISRCVVLLNVCFNCSKLIWHHFIIPSGDTDEWSPLTFNVFACNTYFNSIPTRDNFVGIYWNFTLAISL